MTVLEQDTFTRANQSGWGTASNGDTWATNIGSPTLSIASNEGHATGISAQALLQLGSTTSADAEVLVRVQTSSTSSTRMGAALRVSTNNGYIGRLSASGNNLVIGKIISGTETDLSTTSFTTSISTFYWIRYRIVGTSHFLKAWAAGSAEPAAWTVNGFTDSSITSAGGVGVTINASSTAVTWDFDSFYAVDYPFQDTLTVSDTPSPTVVSVPTESNTTSEVNAATINQNNVTYTTVANDTFNRANQSGWGTASDGTTWGGGTLTYAISSNTGTITGTAGNNYANVLDSELSTAESGFLTFQFTNTNNLKVGVLLRWVDTNNHYFCYADFNAQNITIAKNVSGAFTSLTATSFTMSSATNYDIEFRIIGSNLFAKIWQDGTAIPTSWTLSTTDSSFANTGKVGIFAYSNNSGTITVDNFFVNSYSNGDFLTLTEINNPTVIDLNTDSLTTSDTNAETVIFIPTDQLTTTEVNAATLANTITDILTVVDATKSTVVGLTTDAVTSTETFLNTVIGLITEVSNAADALNSTLGFAATDSLVSSDSLVGMSFFLATLVDVTLNVTDSLLATVIGLNTDQTTNTEIYSSLVAVAFVDILTFANMILTNVYLTDVALNPIDVTTQALSTVTTDTSTITDSLSFALATVMVFIESLTLVELYLINTNTFDFINDVPLDTSTITVVFVPSADLVGVSSDSLVQAFTWLLGDTLVSSDTLTATILALSTDMLIALDQFATSLAFALIDTNATTDTSTVNPQFLGSDSLATSETTTTSLAYASGDTVVLAEIFIGTILPTVTDVLTETENVIYALAVQSLDQVGVNEGITNVLSFASLDSNTIQEQILSTIGLLSTDQLALQDAMVAALVTALPDQNTINDILNVIVIALAVDATTVTDLLSATLANTFTGWTDILTLQEASVSTVIGLQLDNNNTTEILSYNLQFVPTDQLNELEVLSVILSTSLQDTSQLVDSGLFGIITLTTEILVSTESVLWTSILLGLDTILTAVETASYGLLNATTDQSSVLDQLAATIIPVLAADSVTITEIVLYGVIAVPLEQLVIQDSVIFALAWGTVDIPLTITDLLTGLGYAFVDIPLIVSDTLTFTQLIYRLAYARIRSGTANTPIRVGKTVIAS